MPRKQGYVGLDSSKPWMQQAGETAEAYMVFRSYLGQGIGRSVERTKQIAQQKWPKRFSTGKSIETLAMKNYEGTGTWAVRAGVYDAWVLARQQQTSDAGMQSAMQRTLKGYLKFADALLIGAGRLLHDMRTDKTKRIGVRDVREGLRDAQAGLRLALGQPTDITTVEITDLRKRMLDQIARLNLEKGPMPRVAPAPYGAEEVTH